MAIATATWQLQKPINAVVFDCDSTLSTLEGIDEIAKLNGVGAAVHQLTAEAMGNTGVNANLYQQRLALVKPKREQVLTLGEKYFAHKSPNVIEVIQLLKAFNKAIFVISAGLYPAVVEFGRILGIAQENIFAVNVYFDAKGNYLDFEKTSLFINPDGKRIFCQQLKNKYPRILHIGDGFNDYCSHDVVTRFVGYGGAVYYPKVAELCEYYIKTPSMTALLPLCLTQQEVRDLTPAQYALYQQGLAQMELVA